MDIRNVCPLIVISKFQISPIGRTELVSAIRSPFFAIHGQNGHGSHSLIPKVSNVCWLITLTPDPPSTIVLGTSLPLTIVVIAGLLVLTIVSPSYGLEKYVNIGSEFMALSFI